MAVITIQGLTKRFGEVIAIDDLSFEVDRAPWSGSSWRGGATMLIDHDHPPGLFDAGHCWACARQAGLLDHYDRVQGQEANLRQAREWAWAAHRYAIWALGSSGIGVLLAAAALLTR